ncbi:hypothetical protein Poli38472_000533 [Pythium oligandrum]|uniref:Oxidoreductase n=1 Tax=Pythium oligandrum TaxID=41045 RepID=A0A8K1CCN3_PYTOL|nr:hypothetical protein Poli38472_000533 [Pythium oligandrum]|eukprot:TMW60491.1 hypothetical protein Poli38472_000533 [Pythium oligandrum]
MSQATPSSEPIRIGLIGFGMASTVFHVPLIQSTGRFVITHVLERSSDKSAVLEPKPTIVRTLGDLLASPIELVVIASPTSVHFEQAKAAILAKKHVVADKPLCVTAAEAEELVRLASENDVVFTVFQNRRWDSDFLTIKSVIESGKVGELELYEAHYDRYRPTLKGVWREQAVPGSGILYDLGAHLVDQALQLFGVPDDVIADVQIQREGAENDDYFRLELVYNNRRGLKVILGAGMLAKELGPKYILKGTKGRLEKFGEDPQEAMLRDGGRPGDAQWGRESEEQSATLYLGESSERVPTHVGTYEVYYANVADVIRNKTALFVDPRSIVAQIRIIEDAKKTVRVNRVNSE